MTAIRRVPGRFAVRRSAVLGALLLGALILLGAATITDFVSASNLKSMLLLAAFLGLASLGQTLCVLLGGIDLSIAYVIGSANIVLASLIGRGVPPWFACVLVLTGGLGFGALNGLLSYRVQSQALVLTLGTGFAAVGSAQIFTTIGSSYAGNVLREVPDWLTNLSSLAGTTWGLPFPPVIAVWVVAATLTIVLVGNTWLGRSVYAVGGSRVAASRMGISEFQIWIFAYCVSGGAAALTGIALLGFGGGGFAGVGDPYLFTTIAAVVLGGTSLLGGRGGCGATVVGVLALTVLSSILVGWGLDYPAQQAAFGLLIVPIAAAYSRSPHVRTQI